MENAKNGIGIPKTQDTLTGTKGVFTLRVDSTFERNWATPSDVEPRGGGIYPGQTESDLDAML